MRTYPKALLLSLFFFTQATLLLCGACTENTITKEKGTPIENPQAHGPALHPLNTSDGSSQAASLAQNGLDHVGVDTKLGRFGQVAKQSQHTGATTGSDTGTPASAANSSSSETPSNTAAPSSSESATSLSGAESNRYNILIEDGADCLLVGEIEKASKMAQELIKLSPLVSAKEERHYAGFKLMAACLEQKGEKEKAKTLYQRQLQKAEGNGVTQVVKEIEEHLKEL